MSLLPGITSMEAVPIPPGESPTSQESSSFSHKAKHIYADLPVYGETAEINAVPVLLTLKECQAILRFSRVTTKKWVARYCLPIGGVLKVGQRYMVHAWAINRGLAKMRVASMGRIPENPPYVRKWGKSGSPELREKRLAALADGKERKAQERARLSKDVPVETLEAEFLAKGRIEVPE